MIIWYIDNIDNIYEIGNIDTSHKTETIDDTDIKAKWKLISSLVNKELPHQKKISV